MQKRAAVPVYALFESVLPRARTGLWKRALCALPGNQGTGFFIRGMMKCELTVDRSSIHGVFERDSKRDLVSQIFIFIEPIERETHLPSTDWNKAISRFNANNGLGGQ